MKFSIALYLYILILVRLEINVRYELRSGPLGVILGKIIISLLHLYVGK